MQIDNVEAFGKLIRLARKRSGLTQYQLAAAVSMGERFIRELEKGKATCQLGKALMVARLLGITLDLKLPFSDT